MVHCIVEEDWDMTIEEARWHLNQYGEEVFVGEWQSLRGGERDPRMTMIELNNVVMQPAMPALRPGYLAEIVKPNLPWAEDHFQERVSGIPHNPPPSAAYWPYAQRRHTEFTQEEKFSHTYPERFWPQRMKGIRYPYGNLNDVVALLIRQPHTRQAYLPVWYPEDTGVVHGERVPCTLGYHFLKRNDELHCSYTIRSCDFFRHLRDDIYMAARLIQWVAGQLASTQPGLLTMYIHNLHCFAAERNKLAAG